MWTVNTYPGPGHKERPGRFAPGEGSDRAEWISGFGVSPVIVEGHNTPLMLQVTDLGPLVVCSDGKRFVPADLPIAGGHAVAFSPHDGNRAYAFMRHDPEIEIDHGWWRTDDRGKSWQFMVSSPEIRGQQRNLIHDPHPARAAHLYMTSGSQGLRFSIDDGQTWQTLALQGRHVHTLAAVADQEVTRLYAVVSPNEEPVDAGNPGELIAWRITGKAEADREAAEGLRDDVLDVETHADEPNKLWLYVEVGAGQGAVLEADAADPQRTRQLRRGYMRRGGVIRVNPSNVNHMVNTTFGALSRHPWQISTDGGQTWQSFAIEKRKGQDIVPGLIDYGPFNHDSPDHAIIADSHNKIDGERALFGFWPGDHRRVLNYATNMPKPPLLSDDGGLTFEPFATGGTFKPADQIAVSRDGLTRVQAMSEYGLLVTTDAGLSWRGHHHVNEPALRELYAAGEGNPNPWRYKTAWGVAIHPEEPGRIIATYGWNPVHIVRSDDGGTTWRVLHRYQPTLADDDSKPYLDATGVFWHRQDPDVVYVGPNRSDDGGETFQPIPGGQFITSMSPHDGDLVACRQFGSNLWLSSDRGETWSKLPAPPRAKGQSVIVNYSVGAIAFDHRPEHDPKAGGGWRIMVGGLGGVWQYMAAAGQPSGGEWSPIEPTSDDPELAEELPNMRFGYVVQDPSFERANRYYASPGGYTSGDRRLYHGGMLVSLDHGQTWTDLDHAGLTRLRPWWKPTAAPVVVPQTGEVLIADYTGLICADPRQAER